MSKLDEIRETYNRIGQSIAERNGRAYTLPTDGLPDTRYRDDVGYLLGLLEVHPASEPPDNIRDVLVLTVHGHYAVDYYTNGQFRHNGALVKSWQELPE